VHLEAHQSLSGTHVQERELSVHRHRDELVPSNLQRLGQILIEIPGGQELASRNLVDRNQASGETDEHAISGKHRGADHSMALMRQAPLHGAIPERQDEDRS
jgi:hypothetical protein